MEKAGIKKICVIGLGYIGLPTAAILANHGYAVHGTDIKPELLAQLKAGHCPIEEPDLNELARKTINSGVLTVGREPQEADVFIISVPTPFTANHKPDLSFVFDALTAVAPKLKPGNLLVLESTVPVGTTRQVAELLARLRPDLRIAGTGTPADDEVRIAHCPERVLPGRILAELKANDRIVGGVDKLSMRDGTAFYRTFVTGEVAGADAATAEMVKLAENSFRDVNIAFANELSMLCEDLGLNVWEVIRLANRHPRVEILTPGAGVGGHCIAVDPWFLVDSAPKTARLVRVAREVNDHKPQRIIKKAREACARFKKPVIAFLGLTFKPDVDDLRESPALAIVENLCGMPNARALICDPHVKNIPVSLACFANAKMATLEECLEEADIIAALVAHAAFADISAQRLAGKIVIDACGLWRRER